MEAASHWTNEVLRTSTVGVQYHWNVQFTPRSILLLWANSKVGLLMVFLFKVFVERIQDELPSIHMGSHGN